jgi:hypothetical protein
MAATLEPITVVGGKTHVWVARSGPEHVRYGDPFTAACVVLRLDEVTARLVALTQPTASVSMTATLLALREVLRREGFKTVVWERLRNVAVQLDPTTQTR